MEPGTIINGDLYIAAEEINISQSCTIRGNVFAVAKQVTINGRISGSLYVTATDFKMGYYGSIFKDLNIEATNCELNSIIGRNAHIEVTNLNLSSDFKCDGDLDVEASEVTLAGTILKNANISATKLNINSEENDICKIGKDLTYSCPEKQDIESLNIVGGNINYTPYNKNDISKDNNSTALKLFIKDLIIFVVYIYVLCLIIKLIVPKYLNKKHNLNFKSLAKAFGVGLLSFILILPLFILLLITIIGIPFAFILLFIYIILCILAIPVFMFDIAKSFKDKLNLYILFAIVPTIYYLIKAIPVVGVIVSALAFTIALGRIILNIFKK